jgi:hypothetical protein
MYGHCAETAHLRSDFPVRRAIFTRGMSVVRAKIEKSRDTPKHNM